MNSYIETVGYKLLKDDRFIQRNSMSIDQAEYSMNTLCEIEPLPKHLSNILEEGRNLLRSPFSHYSFSIQLSLDS